VLYNIIASSGGGETILEWIEFAALAIEVLAVVIILVLIRTFLSWALVVEIEGRWPWQAHREEV
jgi:hypothetical protein